MITIPSMKGRYGLHRDDWLERGAHREEVGVRDAAYLTSCVLELVPAFVDERMAL